MHAEAGWRPGWDLAGTVIKPAANGTGPGAGWRAMFLLAHGLSRSASVEATIDVSNLIVTGGTTLYALETSTEARSEDLARLAQMVAEQQLRTPIAVEASWHDIGEVAQRFMQRQFTGKAVLHLSRESI
jgi:NADPH:quinone reductase-like Zn-dependent oxidoreductase